MERPLASGDKPRPRRRIVESPWARTGLLIAGVEAILVVVGIIPRWVAVVIAAVVLVAYFARGRQLGSPTVRQGVWALALSQALVLFVPLLLWVLGAIVVLAIAAVAAAVLVLVVLDR
jgi:hypothetical protein